MGLIAAAFTLAVLLCTQRANLYSTMCKLVGRSNALVSTFVIAMAVCFLPRGTLRLKRYMNFKVIVVNLNVPRSPFSPTLRFFGRLCALQML